MSADDGRQIPQRDAQQPCVPWGLRDRVATGAWQRVCLTCSQGRAPAALCQVCASQPGCCRVLSRQTWWLGAAPPTFLDRDVRNDSHAEYVSSSYLSRCEKRLCVHCIKLHIEELLCWLTCMQRRLPPLRHQDGPRHRRPHPAQQVCQLSRQRHQADHCQFGRHQQHPRSSSGKAKVFLWGGVLQAM